MPEVEVGHELVLESVGSDWGVRAEVIGPSLAVVWVLQPVVGIFPEKSHMVFVNTDVEVIRPETLLDSGLGLEVQPVHYLDSNLIYELHAHAFNHCSVEGSELESPILSLLHIVPDT